MAIKSEAQRKAVAKYNAANYDKVLLTVKKGRRENIKDYAAAHGESLNGFINRAIEEAMGRDDDGPARIELPAAVRARLLELQEGPITTDSIVKEIWETQHYVSSILWCNVFYDSKVYADSEDAQAVRKALVECKDGIDRNLDSLIRHVDRMLHDEDGNLSDHAL